MPRGRILDKKAIVEFDKYIKILKPELFPSLSQNAINGFEKLLILSNREGLIDFTNLYDYGLIYTINEIAGSCTDRLFYKDSFYIKKTQNKTDKFFIKVLKELKEKDLIEFYPQSIQIKGHKSTWLWRIRKQISPTIRNYIFKRDNGICQYCGKKLKSKFHVDHVIPFIKSGLDEVNNFVLACSECNIKKRDKTPKEAGMKLIKKERI